MFYLKQKVLIYILDYMKMEKIIMIRFLRKLINLNIWGGRHTELTNLKKALPKHLRGSKETKNAINEGD